MRSGWQEISRLSSTKGTRRVTLRAVSLSYNPTENLLFHYVVYKSRYLFGGRRPLLGYIMSPRSASSAFPNLGSLHRQFCIEGGVLLRCFPLSVIHPAAATGSRHPRLSCMSHAP